MLFWYTETDKENTFNGEGSGFVTVDYARYLQYVDGKTNINNIILSYCNDYKKDFMNEWIPAIRFFNSFQKNGRLHIFDELNSSAHAVRVTGSDQYYMPTNLLIELTTRCNLQCHHCYCNSGPTRKEILSKDKLLQVLETLHQKWTAFG